MGFFERIGLKSKNKFIPLYFVGQTALNKYLYITSKDQILQAYYQTPTLNGIINKMGDVFSKVNYYLTDKEGEYIDKPFRLYHPFYSTNEFLSTYYKQLKLFNECFIFVNSKMPREFDEKTSFLILPAQNMYVIPKSDIKLKDIMVKEDIIDHYELNINGKVTTFWPYEILHITTSSLTFTNDGFLEPDFSLKSAEQPINTIRSAYEARIGLNYRKGGTNVLVNDQMQDGRNQILNEDDIKKLQDDLKKYSFNKDDYQTIVTNATLKNINLNYPVKDLELNEGLKQAKLDLSDVLGFNLLTMNVQEGSTFANKENAEKENYTNLYIPGWKLLQSEFNDYFLNDEQIVLDYSDIEVLQEDRQKQYETNALISNEIVRLNLEIRLGNITTDIAINILVNVYNLDIEQAKVFINENTTIQTITE